MDIVFKVESRYCGEKTYKFEREFSSETDARNFITVKQRAYPSVRYQIKKVCHWWENDIEHITKQII